MTTTASNPPPATLPAPSKRNVASLVAATLLMLLGVGLVVVTVASHLFAVGPAFEHLITDFRPHLTQASIDTARSDIAGLSAVQTEFSTKLAPALSQQLKLTPDQFNGFVTQNFPAVAKGMAALPVAVPTFTGLINTLDQQRLLFASADAIPTKSLPATTVPWGMLGAGILLLLVGLATLQWRKVGSVAALIVGLALVVVPIVLSLPGKAADADQLNANLKPVYTQTLVQNAAGTLGVVGAMGAEMQTKMLPALAAQLNMSPTQLQAYLGSNFPATAQALQTMPASLGRFDSLVKVFDANLGNYNTLKPAHLERLIVILMVAGALTAGIGTLTLVAKRRQ
jgi:hypothetical protein